MVRAPVYPLAQQLMQALQDKGYRDTAPRRALTTVIAGKERHFAAEELRSDLPHLGRATIYRSLKILVEAGAVCRVLLEDGNLHYQLSHRGHHHHLLCVECGVSQDLVGCDVEGALQQAAAQHNFQLNGHWLEVYGRCHVCVAKDDESTAEEI